MTHTVVVTWRDEVQSETFDTFEQAKHEYRRIVELVLSPEYAAKEIQDQLVSIEVIDADGNRVDGIGQEEAPTS
jgi:hypothetical protein